DGWQEVALSVVADAPTGGRGLVDRAVRDVPGTVLARLGILSAWEHRHSLRRRPAAWRQAVLIVFALWLYDKINAQAPTRILVANVHGGQVPSLEKHLHVAFEPSIKHWVAGHALAADVMDYVYLSMQF